MKKLRAVLVSAVSALALTTFAGCETLKTPAGLGAATGAAAGAAIGSTEGKALEGAAVGGVVGGAGGYLIDKAND